MTQTDARIVAALVMLADQLPMIIDEMSAGDLDDDDRGELAKVLATIAYDLAPAEGSPAALGPGCADGVR